MTKIHHHLCKKSRIYHRWHQHHLHPHVHWGVLGSVVLGVALSFVILGWSETEVASVQVARAQTSGFDQRRQAWLDRDGVPNWGSFERNAHSGKSHIFAWLEQGKYFTSPPSGYQYNLVQEINELLQGPGSTPIYGCSGSQHAITLTRLYFDPLYSSIIKGERCPNGACYPQPGDYGRIREFLRGTAGATYTPGANCGMYSRAWDKSTQPIYIVPTFLWTQENDRQTTLTWNFTGEDARFTSSYSGKTYIPSNYNNDGVTRTYNAYELSRDYLFHGFETWARRGSLEMEGNYNVLISTAALALYDFADRSGVPQPDGAEMKKRAKMMLDLMSLDMGMDFSANHHGGARGREYRDNFINGGIRWIYHSLLGLSETTPGYQDLEGQGFASSYRTPALIEDVANVGDEPAGYWHLNTENSFASGDPKWTFVTPYINLGAANANTAIGYQWHLNILTSDGSGRRQGQPFTLWFDSSADSAVNPGSTAEPLFGIGGTPAYQFRNALLVNSWNGDHVHVLKGSATFDVGEGNLAPYGSGQPNDYRIGGGWNFFQEGKTALAIQRLGSCCGGNVTWGMEVAVIDSSAPNAGHVYPSFQAFQDAVRANAQLTGSAFTTSRGIVIRDSNACGINQPGDCQFPFDRIETESSAGKLIDWNSNEMTVKKGSNSCVYNFNSWTSSGNACEGGVTSPPACSDGQDNDGDNRIDLNDPGCSSAADSDEYNAPSGGGCPTTCITMGGDTCSDSLQNATEITACSTVYCAPNYAPKSYCVKCNPGSTLNPATDRCEAGNTQNQPPRNPFLRYLGPTP